MNTNFSISNNFSNPYERQQIDDLFLDSENSSEEPEIISLPENAKIEPIFCNESVEKDLLFQFNSLNADKIKKLKGNIPSQNSLTNQTNFYNPPFQPVVKKIIFCKGSREEDLKFQAQWLRNTNTNTQNLNVNIPPLADINSILTAVPSPAPNTTPTSLEKDAKRGYGDLISIVLKIFQPGVELTVKEVHEALGEKNNINSVRSTMESLRMDGKLMRYKDGGNYKYSLVNTQISSSEKINTLDQISLNQNQSHRMGFQGQYPQAPLNNNNKIPPPPTKTSKNAIVIASKELQGLILSKFTPGKRLKGKDIHAAIGDQIIYNTVTKALECLIETGDLERQKVGQIWQYWKPESKKRSLDEADNDQFEIYSYQIQYNRLQLQPALNNSYNINQGLNNNNNNNNSNSFQNNFLAQARVNNIFHGVALGNNNDSISDNIQIPFSPFVNEAQTNNLIPNDQILSFESLNQNEFENDDPSQFSWNSSF